MLFEGTERERKIKMSKDLIFVTGLFGLLCIGLGIRNLIISIRADTDSLVRKAAQLESQSLQYVMFTPNRRLVKPPVSILEYTASIPNLDNGYTTVPHFKSRIEEDVCTWKMPELQRVFGSLNTEIPMSK